MPERIVPIRSGEDVVLARQAVREVLRSLGFGLADQTRAATAVSEIARNALMFAREGSCTIAWMEPAEYAEVTILIEDRGPGIPDVETAMQERFSTGKSTGAGLPAAKQLMHTFSIESEPGRGTRVTMTMSRRMP